MKAGIDLTAGGDNIQQEETHTEAEDLYMEIQGQSESQSQVMRDRLLHQYPGSISAMDLHQSS